MQLSAQSKIDPAGMLLLKDYYLKQEVAKSSDRNNEDHETIKTIVMLDDASFAEKIEDEGFTITSNLGNIIMVDVPISKITLLLELDGVKYASFGQKQQPMLDYARPSGNVISVQDGFEHNGETLAFDGTGVVCGMMDIGLEGNHVNFKDQDGNSRIHRLWWFDGNNGTGKMFTTDDIVNFHTDNETESHATHVAGIMGGSYKGMGKFAQTSGASGAVTTSITTNGNIPYYGVATGADLAFAVGDLHDANIVQGVKNIVDYAEVSGKPCVVNLSLGGTSGPHDGTDIFTQSLSVLGKQAIICVSAGNDGGTKISVTKSLSADNPIIKTFINGNKIMGVVDIWGDDSKPLAVQWAIYNTATKVITTIASVKVAGDQATVSSSSNDILKSGFSGSISMVADVNQLNNRFNVYSLGSITPLSSNTTLKLALIIEGNAGQNVYVYGNSNASFTSNSMVGWTDGMTNNTINNIACGENIISVGAYTTRNKWGSLSGGTWQYNDVSAYPVNGIAPFSSHGTSFNGTMLPLVCAPGANIISSYSRYYIAKGYPNETANDMAASAKNTLLTDYWGAMQGTSMSCPFVSGVIGLWLQADPTLDYARVMEVIEKTSDYNPLVMRDGRWGYGKINALAGLKYVLDNKASIEHTLADKQMIITPLASGYEIYVAGASVLNVSIYDLQGRLVASAAGSNNVATIDASAIENGIYILKVEADGLTQTRKISYR